jgi:uncharacterized protein involved in exopolysaccharide biosynthesis/Mrp family chromosome partitioning ATPase
MAFQLAIDPRASSPLAGKVAGRALVPHAPTVSLALSSPSAQVDQSPYLSTPPPQFTEAVLNLADLFGYLRRYGWIGLLLGLPVSLFVFWFLGMGANVYEAEAKLRLRIGESNVLKLPELGRQGVTELSAPQLVNNHLTELKSRRFAEFLYDRFDPDQRKAWVERLLANPGRKAAILKMLGLYKPGEPPAEKDFFVDQVLAAVIVEPLKESHILRIIAHDGSAEMAALLANSYAREYIRFFGVQESGLTQGERDYLQKKAESLRARLEESERRLAEFRRAENFVDTGEARNVDSARMLQFNTAITDAQQRLIRARNDLETIRFTQQAGRDLTEVRVVGENPDVAFTRKELDAKMAQRRALEPLCGRRHPQMIALSGQIETLRASLSRAIDAVVTMTESEVVSLQRQIEDYQKQLDSARGMAVDQSGKNVEYNLLLDQVNADRQMYQTIVSSLNKAEVTGEFTESGALSLADVASPPDKPAKPNKPVAAFAALMIFGLLGLGLPVGWGLLDEHVLQSFRRGGSPSVNIPSARDVPHVPVGQSPMAVRTNAQPSARLIAPPPSHQAQVARYEPMAQPSLPGLPGAPVIARLPRLASAYPEAMLSQLLKPEPQGASGSLQQLTTLLEMQALKRSGLGGIILITSAEPGEGKTAAASALAAAFCHQGRSVFMMECNAVSPALHQCFPHAGHHSSWAHDLESLRYGNTHLFLLPAHDLPAYATNELLDGYRAWIDRARQHVDWIILDSGPVLRNFADVAPLAPLATDVIVVNHPAISPPAKLKAAMNLLQPMMSSSAFRGIVLQE